MAHDVFDHHDGAVDDHAKIQSSERQEVRGNVSQVQTNGGEQQRERNGRGDDEGAANIAEKQQQNERYQDHPFGKVVQHGVSW